MKITIDGWSTRLVGLAVPSEGGGSPLRPGVGGAPLANGAGDDERKFLGARGLAGARRGIENCGYVLEHLQPAIEGAVVD